MALKHVFYFLSLFKNHVNKNVNYLIQWNICEQRLNIKRCHKKIWILIKDFFTKNGNESLTVYSLVVNCFNIGKKFFAKNQYVPGKKPENGQDDTKLSRFTPQLNNYTFL